MLVTWVLWVMICALCCVITGALVWYTQQSTQQQPQKWHDDYFLGLRQLIDDQTDQAIDTFIKILEVNAETVETYLALGGLFRRRGEFSRAIRVHRNIIARPNLDRLNREKALLGLAKDYLASGLLDRAEGVLQRLSQDAHDVRSCWQYLLELYQRQKDWSQAIEVALLLYKAEPSLATRISHFYCECADNHRFDHAKAEQYLKLAERYQVTERTRILRAACLLQRGQLRKARKHYESLLHQAPHLLTQLLPDLQQCYLQKGDFEHEYYDFLCGQASLQGSDALLGMAATIQANRGYVEATQFLEQCWLHAEGQVVRLVHWLEQRQLMDIAQQSGLWSALARGMLNQGRQWAHYRCGQCGLQMHQHHWVCQACQSWSTVEKIK